jgi:hypothetical protein
VKLVRVRNASQVPNLLNAKLVKEKELLILDKVLCRSKWVVLLVEEKALLIITLVLHVRDREFLIGLNKRL